MLVANEDIVKTSSGNIVGEPPIGAVRGGGCTILQPAGAASLEAPRRRLPRDVPFWLRDLPSHACEVRDGRFAVPSEVLAISSGGDGRACLYSQADDALEQLVAEAQVECIDDAAWEIFPEIGAALSRLFTKEECICIAVCQKLDAFAVGISMSTRMRKLSAKVALATTLALRSQASAMSLESCPFIARFADEARRSRQKENCSSESLPEHVGATCAANAGLSNGEQLRPCIRLTSPCTASAVHWAEPASDTVRRKNLAGDVDGWVGHCVCCKRPLTLTLEDPPNPKRCKIGQERYAYVCALWGTDPQFVLGAMVLGWSLRRTGTKHDLVILHTSDVAPAAVALLKQAGWKVRKVPYVRACDALFYIPLSRNRFANVFTKLHVLGLIEYDKVLMLDSDILVRENIDHLFSIEAPAAMARGQCSGYKHGQRIDGRCFFSGGAVGTEAEYSWGQCTGINAGVMLLQPSLDHLDLCLSEIADPLHPEHIRGCGPEQDYLSRYFASDWNHIGVEYNFQLHHLYFTLNPFASDANADRLAFLHDHDALKAFHYSTHPKPWSRHMDKQYASMSDDEWLKEVLGQFSGYRSWVQRDPLTLTASQEWDDDSMALGPDGELYRAIWNVGKDGGRTKELGERVMVSEWAVNTAETVTKLALRLWDEAYKHLAVDMDVADLAAAVVEAAASDPSHGGQDGSRSAPVADIATKACSDWYVDKASSEGRKATILATLVPEPVTAISLDGVVLMSGKMEGIQVTVVSTATNGATHTLKSFSVKDSIENVSEWAKTVPVGASILMAVVSLGSERICALLKTLACELGCETLAELPQGCNVATAAGRKGDVTWHDTHASAEVATVVVQVP